MYNSWAGESETDYCLCELADFARPAARAPARSGVLPHLEVPPCVASIKFWTLVSVYLLYVALVPSTRVSFPLLYFRHTVSLYHLRMILCFHPTTYACSMFTR
jgi:hypothetical protein